MRGVAGVAVWIQRADTGPVLAPFMLPEGFVISSLVFPIGIHVVQEAGCTVRLQDGGDIGILAVHVTVLIVGAVTVVGPGRSKPRQSSWKGVRRIHHRP